MVEFNQNKRNVNEKFKFSDMGLGHPIVKTNDMSQASNKLSVSAEAASFTAGAAGTTGIIGLDKAPIFDSTGSVVGDLNDTSFAWVTGTVLTTEVAWDYEVTDTVQLAALANGEFALDYVTGKIRYSKATTGTSDTSGYTTRQTNSEITTLSVSAVTEATHSSAFVAKGPQIMLEAADIDGAALPNTSVVEGDAVRPKGSAEGVAYSTLLNEDGSKSAILTEDTAHSSGDVGFQVLAVRQDAPGTPLAGTDGDYIPLVTDALGALYTMGANSHDLAVGTTGIQLLQEAADFDGSALPNAVAEGDAVRSKASLQGVQYVMVVNEDGSTRPAYDSSTDSFKQFEVNPISDHHQETTLIDVTNETDATTNYYFDMDGYKTFALQMTLSGGSGTMTVTVEASVQDDGTAAASCTYIDVTSDWFGSASFTASALLERDVAAAVKYVKVKTVSSTGGSNDADATVYLKKMY